MIKREFKPTLSHRLGIIMASFCSPLVTRHPSPPPRMTGQLSRLPHAWWPQHIAINQHFAMHNAAAINFAINWQIYIAKHHEDTLLHWLCLYNRMETHLHVCILYSAKKKLVPGCIQDEGRAHFFGFWQITLFGFWQIATARRASRVANWRAGEEEADVHERVFFPGKKMFLEH